MMEGGYKKYDKFHLWDFVGEQKAKGLVKHMRFSFHSYVVESENLYKALLSLP